DTRMGDPSRNNRVGRRTARGRSRRASRSSTPPNECPIRTYSPASAIWVSRVARRLTQIADAGEYVLIGHSLGGVLLREALRDLPRAVRRPTRLFLLGSPIRV